MVSQFRDLGLIGLEGWTVRRAAPPLLPEGPWTWTDGDGTEARRIPGEGERFLYRTTGLGTVLVDFGDRTILLHDVGPDPALSESWVGDQVAARILSHLGHLVVHAGGSVTPDLGAFLIVAPSQHGKSTLTAFLHQGGWPIMGDDAVILRPDAAGVSVRSVYRRLKLRRDSWRQLYPDATEEPPPGWKAIIGLEEDRSAPEATEHPLRGIFCLAPPDGSGDCRAERLSAAQACLELVRNSYALDPSDPQGAGRRLAVAAAATRQVPGFRLAYPRDYARLPEVREVIRGALAAAS